MGNHLKIYIYATPVGGKATYEMEKFLATVFDVAKTDIEIVFERFTLHKKLRILNPRKLIAGILPCQL